ncbi:MAG: hypothetical protein CBB71_02865 [Rhodopirellula sp. TMED11]|nr:MAG: hypothetical protein CBB71_02865 [Rhodopirellula sp. TMED11]
MFARTNEMAAHRWAAITWIFRIRTTGLEDLQSSACEHGTLRNGFYHPGILGIARGSWSPQAENDGQQNLLSGSLMVTCKIPPREV